MPFNSIVIPDIFLQCNENRPLLSKAYHSEYYADQVGNAITQEESPDLVTRKEQHFGIGTYFYCSLGKQIILLEEIHTVEGNVVEEMNGDRRDIKTADSEGIWSKTEHFSNDSGATVPVDDDHVVLPSVK